MKLLVAGLSALPETAPAPPLRVVPKRAARSVVAIAAPWLLAAAAALAWWLTPGAPEITIGSGETRVGGNLSLLAGDVTIDLDGEATIGVEPRAGGARVAVEDPEEPMTRQQMIAGLTGAAVTVAVYEGTAAVRAAGGDPVVVGAGQSRLFGGAPGRAGAAATDREALEDRLVSLERELAATREALELEQFSGALARGQLEAEQGVPSPWPSTVPPGMTADRFAAELTSRLEGVPEVEIEVVDCAEYPCIAAVRYVGADQSLEWGGEATEKIAAWAAEAYGADHALSLNRSKFVEDDREARYIVFGAHGADEDPNVKERESWRMETLVEQLAEELRREGR
jgi:hypothetical protein